MSTPSSTRTTRARTSTGGSAAPARADLTGFGIGIVIGTGIFTLTGIEAKNHAGPAIVISFAIAGVVSMLAALCYAELAAAVPTAGSSYTYAYTTIGEIFAWIIAWDLILEFALGAAVVSRGWSAYLQDALGLPDRRCSGRSAPVNVGAVLIAAVLGVVAAVGIRESKWVTNALVLTKVAVCVFVIVAGLFFLKTAHWLPFVPPSRPAPARRERARPAAVAVGLRRAAERLRVRGRAGRGGRRVLRLQRVRGRRQPRRGDREPRARHAPRADRHPGRLHRALPARLPGADRHGQLRRPRRGRADLRRVPPGRAGLGRLPDRAGRGRGPQLGDPRRHRRDGPDRLRALRDGLLPASFGKVHPKFRTPTRITVVTTAAVCLLGAFVPLDTLAEMVSIGTLFAFVVVSVAVAVLRRTAPQMRRPFRTPLVPLLPIVSALSCVALMASLAVDTWIRFLVWLAIGLVVYFGYGRRHSVLARAGTGDGAVDTTATGRGTDPSARGPGRTGLSPRSRPRAARPARRRRTAACR